jgi:GH15 family glucan-1,4-alpha-glucosidase
VAYGLGIIGNCSYSALVHEGSVDWMCWPRPDSSFVFGRLLDREKGGVFAIEGVGADSVVQSYVENTNVLRTTFSGPEGQF